MHEQVLMRVGNRAHQLHHQTQAITSIGLTRVAPVVNRSSVDILHHDVGHTGSRLAAVDQMCNVGVIERGQCPPFAAQPCQQDITCHATNHFDRSQLHKALLGPVRQPDAAHAALTQRSFERPCAHAVARREPPRPALQKLGDQWRMVDRERLIVVQREQPLDLV